MRHYATSALLCGLICSMAAILPDSVQGQDGVAVRPIGKVVTTAGSVTIEHVNAVIVQANLSAGAAQTKVGDAVYQGDVVQTGVDGKVGITFTDGTAFNVSRNARMVLNEFVYDPNSKSNSSLINLTKGTFTFVAGQVAKTGDMKVETPVATMGIRGTTPHVEISDNGTVAFSTLVEEGRGRTPGKRAATGNQRQATSASPSTPSVRSDLDKNLTIKLKICKDC
jgi:hypothetical protein